VGVFYHSDPAGFVPSGIDTFIRGLLRYAPPDLQYTLFGATSDPIARPVGEPVRALLDEREVEYFPLIAVDASAARSFLPLTLQYMWALRGWLATEWIRTLDILDFHRIEPTYLFRKDLRPKNVILHQDMSVLRDPNTDIKWRHLPSLYEHLEGRAFRCLDHVYAVRESAVARYKQRYPAMERKFSFIPTWVDTDLFAPAPAPAGARDNPMRSSLRQTLGLPIPATILVFVGRLDRQKDPLLLLEAFRRSMQRHDDLHLVIVGDGALRTRVIDASLADDLRGRITIAGVLPRHKIAEVLRAADLFVLSSAYEGMPIAVLEALATGLPVVSTDVGELRRVVCDGVNGYLCSSRSADALGHTITTAVADLHRLRPEDARASIELYRAESVLEQIYENHRRQSSRPTSSAPMALA
jgi:glycosyltransferase involved in cell wall biosynthesis